MNNNNNYIEMVNSYKTRKVGNNMKKKTYENMQKVSKGAGIIAGIGTCIGAGVGVIMNIFSNKVEEEVPDETKTKKSRKTKEAK